MTIESLRLIAHMLGKLILSMLVATLAAIFVIAVMLSSLDSPQALSERGVVSAVYWSALLGLFIGAVRVLFFVSSMSTGYTRRASFARELVEQAIAMEKSGSRVEWILMPRFINSVIETTLTRVEPPFATGTSSDVMPQGLEDQLLRESVLDGVVLRAALEKDAEGQELHD